MKEGGTAVVAETVGSVGNPFFGFSITVHRNPVIVLSHVILHSAPLIRTLDVGGSKPSPRSAYRRQVRVWILSRGMNSWTAH